MRRLSAISIVFQGIVDPGESLFAAQARPISEDPVYHCSHECQRGFGAGPTSLRCDADRSLGDAEGLADHRGAHPHSSRADRVRVDSEVALDLGKKASGGVRQPSRAVARRRSFSSYTDRDLRGDRRESKRRALRTPR